MIPGPTEIHSSHRSAPASPIHIEKFMHIKVPNSKIRQKINPLISAILLSFL